MCMEGFEAIETAGSWLYDVRNMWLKDEFSIERDTGLKLSRTLLWLGELPQVYEFSVSK